MSHKNVEILIGKLASDEDLRRQFLADPLATIRALESEHGFEFTPVEVDALQSLDQAALQRLARGLDPRLQKASLHTAPARPGRAKKSRGGKL